MKLLFKSFHLNGHTLGFHSQILKLETPYIAQKTEHHERTAQ